MPTRKAARPRLSENGSPSQTEVLAKEVRFHRKQRGVPLEALAERSGVSRSMISKIERGEAVPSTAVLSRLAEALGAHLLPPDGAGKRAGSAPHSGQPAAGAG